jgi:hypothetical protein
MPGCLDAAPQHVCGIGGRLFRFDQSTGGIARKSLRARAVEADLGFTRGLNPVIDWTQSRTSLEINEVRSWQ